MNTAKPAPDVPPEEAGSSAQVHPVEALAEEYLRRYRQGEQEQERREPSHRGPRVPARAPSRRRGVG